MNITIELSDSSARRFRDELADRLLNLQCEAEQLEKDIAAIDSKLNGQLQLTVEVPKTKSGKSKKGENARIIESFLKPLGATGSTAANISEMTKIPYPSCIGTLKRRNDIFAKGQNDGLWRIKRDAFVNL